ncbi:MAG: hypothetical protein AABY53_08385 [Bdellovibrionota bacterium]
MKNIILFMTLSVLGFQANAKMPKKPMTLCEALYEQAEKNCTKYMCEEQTDRTGSPGKCVLDGDFYEGLQICVTEGEFPDLIKEYNKKHPGKNLNCDQ